MHSPNTPNGPVILYIYIQPGAAETAWAGTHDGVRKLRLKSRPIDGQANQALINFLAKEYQVSPSRIELIKGEKSRYKTLKINI